MADIDTGILGAQLVIPDRASATHGLLADPERELHRYTIISVDDHLVEPRDLFVGRVAAGLADRVPRVVTLPEGDEAWEFDGQVFRQMGLNAVVGRPREDWSLEPTRFDEMRRGCWDVDERIKDMDLAGIYASISFPSAITGFCGSVFSRCSDPNLGLAVTRAWNDWLHEAWCGQYPERLIRMGITWLADPELGAAEIRRNAARGFVRGDPPRAAPQHRAPVDLLGLLGPDPLRLRGDRHRRLPPCRLLGNAGHGSRRSRPRVGR